MFSAFVVLLGSVALGIGAVIPFVKECAESAVNTRVVFAGTGGVVLDGPPLGNNVTINGVLTYVSLPKGTFANDTAIVFLTDIFGLPLNDNLLLADDFARQGFATYVPDYLNGDAFPSVGGTETIAQWFTRHGQAQTIPPLLAVINQLKSQGITKLAASGYCFGGLYATLLAQNNTIEVATMAHPSALTVPDDFDVLKAQSDVPIQIQSASLDTALTPALATQVDSIMDDGQYSPGYNRTNWDGVGHGFAVRVNLSDPVQVGAKIGAFFSSLAWIKEHID